MKAHTPETVITHFGFEPPAGQAEALAEAIPELRQLMAIISENHLL